MTKIKNATKAVKKATAVAQGAKAKTASKAKPAAAAAPGKARGKRGKAATDATAPAADKTATGRHRWKAMSLEQLQALYAEKVGRTTNSEDRGYLTWKIREAEAGRIRVGPAKEHIEGPKTAVTILFGTDTLDGIDVAAKTDGFPTRLGFLRDVMRRGLEIRGHAALAAQLPG